MSQPARHPRLWLVAAEVPSLRGGAPVRNYNLIKQYSRLGYDVQVFCIDDNPGSPDAAKLAKLPGVRVVSVDLPAATPLSTLKTLVFKRVLPFMEQFRSSKLVASLLAALHKEGAPDFLQLEQVNGYYAVESVLPEFRQAGSTIVLDAHNVEQAALRGSIRLMPAAKRLAGHWVLPHYQRIENRAARQADAVFACSETDRAFFEELGCPDTHVIPNGVDLTHYKVAPPATENALTFTGGTGWPPNEDALKWYLHAVHSLVKEKVPDVRLYILGGTPPEWLQTIAAADDTVKPRGFVDDIREYLHKAKVCISPVRHGSGTSLKVLEYLASAKAVVSTYVGARGIACTHDKNIMLSGTAPDFAEQVVHLLQDSDANKRLGAAGRRLIEQQYQWDTIGGHADKALKTLQPAKPKRTASTPPAWITLGAGQLLAAVLGVIGLANLCIAISMPTLLRGFVVVPVLALLPGLLILSGLRVQLRDTATRLLYACGLSLAYLMLGGVLYNNLAFAAGVDRPLDRLPVWLFVTVSLAALSVWQYFRNRRKQYAIRRPGANRLSLAVAGASLASVFIMTGGANTLNNGGTNYLTILGLLLVAGLMAACFYAGTRLRGWVLPHVIYCSALALLLMYSLRSGHILGWDIHLEHQVFRMTEAMGRWSMSFAKGEEYNACLSITVLPTILHRLLGGSGEFIFKVTMQVLFAGVPVGVYLLSKRYVTRPVALAAAGVYLSQTWFIEQLPALVRQQAAFIFLILVIMTVLDQSLGKRARYGLVALFSGGMVVSHYSTTYIWAAMALLACIALLALRCLRLVQLRRYALFPVAVVMTLVLGVFWNSLYTRTANNTQGFVKGFVTHAHQIFTVDALRGGVEQIGFSGEDTAADLPAAYQDIRQQYAAQPARLYPTQPYQPQPMAGEPEAPSALPAPASTGLLAASKVVKVLALNIFPLAGVAYAIFALRKKRKEPDTAGYAALCTATLPLIAAVLFLPFIQANYNLTRLFMQIFLVLALPAVIGSCALLRAAQAIRPLKRWGSSTALALVWALFFLYSTGFVHQIAGGPVHTTLSHTANTHDPFFVHDGEVRAAVWLGEQRAQHPRTQVYADSMASLRLKGFSDITQVTTDVFPTTIARDSFVYLGQGNVAHGRAYLIHQNDALLYAYPRDFLEQHKNAVYSNGKSIIYR